MSRAYRLWNIGVGWKKTGFIRCFLIENRKEVNEVNCPWRKKIKYLGRNMSKDNFLCLPIYGSLVSGGLFVFCGAEGW